MKRRLAGLIAPLILIASMARAAGPTPLEWSARMADSEMARRGDNLAYRAGGPARWDYTAGLFTLSLLKLDERLHDERYVKFAERAIGSFIDQNGIIQGYKAEDYNLDNINPGKTVLALWQRTKEDRFRKAAALLRTQFDKHPRTAEGGFWHKQRYPQQMWLDGLYMGGPFLAEYGRLFNEPADFDEVAKQILLVAEHTYDPKTGLFYHGWDSSKQQDWANKSTGTSPNFWGRAVGWYGMAIVDALDFLPTNHAARPQIIEWLNKLCAGVARHQDPASGLWYQVLDQQDRQGNYLEATASAMFVYTMAKAVNKGYIPRDTYVPVLTKGYDGIVVRLIKTDPNGSITLTKCCSVSGLGYGRDGSFGYYVGEPIVDNDLKGVGPFILAGIELHQLLGLAAAVAPAAAPRAAPATRPATAPSAADWSQMQQILARIKAPTFPDRQFQLTNYGLVAGSQQLQDVSEALRRAITDCNSSGGGRVVVPPGAYLTGPVHLKSNVNLHLEQGATLLFKQDPGAYLPVVFTRFEGMEFFNYSPFIYAFEQENIAITGLGTLDGQADNTHWWPWARTASQQNQRVSRAKLTQQVEENIPVEQRQYGDGAYMRPVFIQPYRCRNILIEGVSIRRSPMWEINPVLCTNVTVRGVNIVSHGVNNDGCNPESSKDVLIEDCLFDTGDDCIAIKSGRNNDGRRLATASENIIIRRCTMKDGHGGVTIGSEISGDCRNVFVEDCTMDSPNLDRVLRMKSNALRGGTIENIFMRNITVGRVANEVLQIDFVYEGNPQGAFRPAARNIVMENITVKQTPRVMSVVGIPGSQISNVKIVNSTFENVRGPDVVRDAQDVQVIGSRVDRTQ